MGSEIEELLNPPVGQDRLHRMLHGIGLLQPHQILIRGGGGEVLLEIGGGEVGADQPVLELNGLAVLAMEQQAVEEPSPRFDIEGDRRLVPAARGSSSTSALCLRRGAISSAILRISNKADWA